VDDYPQQPITLTRVSLGLLTDPGIPPLARNSCGGAQVGDDDMVAFLHLHGSRPVGGEQGTEVEWRYSYQVIPPGGPAADTDG
jgi:hypothetical protein